MQYTFITCISVLQQSTDEKSGLIDADKDSYWSDSWPEKCLEEIMQVKRKFIREDLQEGCRAEKSFLIKLLLLLLLLLLVVVVVVVVFKIFL